MDDDCGFSVSIPKKTTKKRTPVSDFDMLDSQPWYQDYNDISDLLVTQLESIHTDLRDSAVKDVVQFVGNYKYTIERIPVITLFTGFNSPDHNSVLSKVSENLDKDREINCQMVILNPTKTSSLKALIESVVYDFVNQEMEYSSDEEDDKNPIAKSKCSLLHLTNWYLNNYGPLNELIGTDDDSQITHLIVVIQDIGVFPKQILNDFLKTISAFRDRLPFTFLVGVPYTLNTLEKRFTSEVYSKLAIYPFQSRPSFAFLENVLEEVFLGKNCIFHMGPDVFKILCRYYMNYNFSVTEFIKGAKLCVLEHFSQSPAHATFCCDPEQNNISERIDDLTDDDIAFILQLPSLEKYNATRKMSHKSKLTVSSPTVKDELKTLYNEFNTGVIRFNAAVQCLNLLMKSLKEDKLVSPLQDIYWHVMDTEKRKTWLETNLRYIGVSSKHPLLVALKKVEEMLKNYDESQLSSISSKLSKFINKLEESQLEVTKSSPSRSPGKADRSPMKVTRSPMRITRSPMKVTRSPMKVTRSPMKVTRSPMKTARSPRKVSESPIKETTSPFKTPKSCLKATGASPLKSIRTPLLAANSPSVKASPTARRALFTTSLKTSACKGTLQSEFIETRKELMEFLQQDFLKLYLKSLDDIPLRELFIYNDYETIERLLDPIPRTALNNALENPVMYLECECCELNLRDEVLKTMPDLSIVYKLHKECGNVINLFDWFQQFRVIVDKKTFKDNDINPEIYARFVHAMKELHFLGYISLPKKKSTGMEFVTKFAYF